MTTTAERDALLDAVFAHPDDDTPRLIYADWLDEHGEGVHAEFIRRQIELERFNGRPTARAAVKNREVAAWRRYDRWLSGRFPGMVFSKEYFERGFHKGRGGEQYITPTEFLTHSDRWWPWLPVRWVRMHAQDQYPDELLESGHLPRLRRLSLYPASSSESIREGFVVRLFSSTRFTRLSGLDVYGVPLSRPVVDAILGSPFLQQLGRLRVNYGASGRSGCLAYPEGIAATELDRSGEPGGAPAAIERQLDELRGSLLEVPPGATAWGSLIDPITQQPTAVFRWE